MYLMYVDETGDTGLTASPTRYFGLSGIVVHESEWRRFISELIAFKKNMASVYNLPIRAELHASELINKNKHQLEKHIRLAILRNTLDELAKFDFISITNVVVDKEGKPEDYDVFNMAWMTLFQRFENTLVYGNFPGGFRNDHGLVITDATSGEKLSRLVRRMAVHNFIPNQGQFGQGAINRPVVRIIEDPYGKDSRSTLPIQMADVCAYFLKQRFDPSSYIRRKSARHYFDRLSPRLNLRASRTNPLGIVQI